MRPKNSLKQYPVYAFLTLLLISSLSYAEIFKWVDENGQTHYSDKKENTGRSKVEELKVDSSPNIISGHQPETAPSFIKERPEPGLQNKLRPIERQKRSSLFENREKAWGGNEPQTDQTRCALARDIISGDATHSNGAPTDKYDIKVAQRDIRKFCK